LAFFFLDISGYSEGGVVLVSSANISFIKITYGTSCCFSTHNLL